MKINSAVLAYHNANRYYEIFSEEGLLGKKQHTKNVIVQSEAIAKAKNLALDMDLLAICAEHHDDGRVDQYKLLGKFWDTEVSHNVLSIDRFEKFISNEDNLTIDSSIEILRDVMLYHGRMHLADLSANSLPYVEVITAADDFENALSCVSYLVKEVETDAKGYIQKNPSADQKEVSLFVWEHFCNGEKFDKIKFCTTYAEYILFAATLATSCIKKYGDIAKIALYQEGYGYSSIIEGYRNVFKKTLNPDMAEKAISKLISLVG